MKTFRRPLLDPIRNKSGYVAQAQQMQRDIRDLQRAPVRVAAVVIPQKKPLPIPTPVSGACVPDRMFIVENDDLFSFDGAVVAYMITDDPNITSGSLCVKTYNGKIFWIAETSSARRIFRSLDSGATSTFGDDPGGDLYGVAHFDVSADGTIYAIVGDASSAIYKSTDDGETWSLLLGSLDPDTFQAAICCDPADATRIAFLELDNGVGASLHVSVDSGSTWSTLVLAAPWTNPCPPFGFGFQPRWLPSGRLVWLFYDYSAGAMTAFWSDDVGASIAGSLELMDPATLAWCDGMWMDTDGVLYVAARDTSDDTHIFRSPDGSTWSDMGTIGANSSRVQGIAFMAGDMYVLNDWPEMWKIPDPGTTWVPELILDSGSGFPFGTGDTAAAIQDALVAACPI